MDKLTVQYNNIAITHGVLILNDPLFHLQEVVGITVLNDGACLNIAHIVGLAVADKLYRAGITGLILGRPVCGEVRAVLLQIEVNAVGDHTVGILLRIAAVNHIEVAAGGILSGEEGHIFFDQDIVDGEFDARFQGAAVEHALDLQDVTVADGVNVADDPLFQLQIVLGFRELDQHAGGGVAQLDDLITAVKGDDARGFGLQLGCPGGVSRQIIGLHGKIDTVVAVFAIHMAAHNAAGIDSLLGLCLLLGGFRIGGLLRDTAGGFCGGLLGRLVVPAAVHTQKHAKHHHQHKDPCQQRLSFHIGLLIYLIRFSDGITQQELRKRLRRLPPSRKRCRW